LRAVATAIGVPLESGSVRAEGDLDFRGTLGVDREAPVGFRDIRLSFDLDSAADEEALATLLKLTERYCVVYQTIRNGPAVAVSLRTQAHRIASRSGHALTGPGKKVEAGPFS
ncbi:MAG: OsmC family protein, partial [Rhodospirillales bacterium]|nr:OsmC family protein [Rhodospirillales bacterium]